MLTEDERALIRKAFSQGPAALFDAGLDPEAIHVFLERGDVQAELHMLEREFKNQEAIYGRTRFIAKRQLTRLTPGAAAILGRALAGPIYSRDDKGNVLLDVKGQPLLAQPEPSPTQMRAAENILDRMGIEGKTAVDKTTDVNVTLLLKDAEAKTIEVSADPALETKEEQALSRERMRTAMDQLKGLLPKARETLVKKLLPGKKNGGKSKEQAAKRPTGKSKKAANKKA